MDQPEGQRNTAKEGEAEPDTVIVNADGKGITEPRYRTRSTTATKREQVDELEKTLVTKKDNRTDNNDQHVSMRVKERMEQLKEQMNSFREQSSNLSEQLEETKQQHTDEMTEMLKNQHQLRQHLREMMQRNEQLQMKLEEQRVTQQQSPGEPLIDTLWPTDLHLPNTTVELPVDESTPKRATTTSKNISIASSTVDQGTLRTVKQLLPWVERFDGSDASEYTQYRAKIEAAFQAAGYMELSNLDEQGELLLWSLLTATCGRNAYLRISTLKGTGRTNRGTNALQILDQSYLVRPSAQAFLRAQQQLNAIQKSTRESISDFEIRFRRHLEELRRIAKATNMKIPEPDTLAALVQYGAKADKRFNGAAAMFLVNKETGSSHGEDPLAEVFRILYLWENENNLTEPLVQSQEEEMDPPTSASFSIQERQNPILHRKRNFNATERRCFNCESPKHIARDCPTPKTDEYYARARAAARRIPRRQRFGTQKKRVTWAEEEKNNPATNERLATAMVNIQENLQKLTESLTIMSNNNNTETEQEVSFVGMMVKDYAFNTTVEPDEKTTILLDGGSGWHYCGQQQKLMNERRIDRPFGVETAGGDVVCRTCGELYLYLQASDRRYVRVKITVHRLPTKLRYILVSEHMLDDLVGTSKVRKLRTKNGRVIAQLWSYEGSNFVLPKDRKRKCFTFQGQVNEPHDVQRSEIHTLDATKVYSEEGYDDEDVLSAAMQAMTSMQVDARKMKKPKEAETLTEPSESVRYLDCVLGFPSTKILRKILKDMQHIGKYEKLSVDKQVKRVDEYIASRQQLKKKKKRKDGPVLTNSLIQEYGTGDSFRIISADLFEPKIESLRKTRYMILFLDNRSGFCVASGLKTKSAQEVTAAFQHYILAMQTGPKVRIVFGRGTMFYSDGAAAFKSSTFTQMLASKGFKQLFSSPGSHTQNGLIERRIQLVTMITRGLLLRADLSTQFWDQGFAWATYLGNLWSNNQEPSPYEKITGDNPAKLIAKLLPFGTRVRHIKLKAQQPGGYCKLQPRGQVAIVVGYSERQQSHMLFDPETKRISHSNEIVVVPNNEAESTDAWAKIPRLEEPKRQQYAAYCARQTHDIEEFPAMDITGTIVEHTDRLDSLIYANDQAEAMETGDNTTSMATLQLESDIEEAGTAFLIANSMSFHQVLRLPEGDQKEGLLSAYNDEIQQLQAKDVWEVISTKEVPRDSVILTPVTRLSAKLDSAGNLKSYKARICANGNRQIATQEQRYAPTATLWVIKLLLAVAAAFGFNVSTWDISGAYLHANIERQEPPTLMHPPPMFVKRTHPDGGKNILRLKKALYGLRTSGNAWNALLTKSLKEMNMVQLLSDTAVFKLKKQVEVAGEGETMEAFVVCAIFVDDGLTISNHEPTLQAFYEELKEKFPCKVQREPSDFLGIRLRNTEEAITLDQEAYATRTLENHGMSESNSMRTPMVPRRSAEMTQLEPLDQEGATEYASIVGALRYLLHTRPTLTFAVNTLSRSLKNPTEFDKTRCKRVLRYLKGTTHHGLKFPKLNPAQRKEALEHGLLSAFSDASLGDHRSTGKSTIGTILCLAGTPFRCDSNLSKTVATSSCYAEYQGIHAALQRIDAARNLLIELELPLPQGFTTKEAVRTVRLGVDNAAAQTISTQPLNSERSRHFNLKYHSVREACREGRIRVYRVAGTLIPSDGLTKPLGTENFQQYDRLIREGENDKTRIIDLMPSLEMAPPEPQGEQESANGVDNVK